MRRLFVIAIALTIGLPIVAVLLMFAAAGSQAQCGGGGPAAPGSAPGIPASLLGIYDQAAGAYQLGAQGWAYLAAINYVETRFGQDLSPSSQGAIGWMQFEPDTWAQYAVSADPTKPGAPPDPYDPWDAIFATANDLHANGAPGDWPQAIYAYNHAGWYVSQVQQLAHRYTQTAGSAAAIDSPRCPADGLRRGRSDHARVRGADPPRRARRGTAGRPRPGPRGDHGRQPDHRHHLQH